MTHNTFNHFTAQETPPETEVPAETVPFDASLPQQKGLKGIGIGIGIGLSIGVLVTLGVTSRPSSSPQNSPSPATVEAPTTSVTLTDVRRTPVQRTLKATGTVAAVEPISVLSEAVGLQIEQVLADEGDYVEAGQVLVILDDGVQQAELRQTEAAIAQAQARLAELKAGTRPETIAQSREKVQRIVAEVEQAKSDWELAQKRVERNQALQAEGAIAQDRLDEVLNVERSQQSIYNQARARLREAQQELQELERGTRPEVIAQATAQLAEAKARYQQMLTQLENTRIVAPVSGKISERDARVGSVTASSQKLFTIIENGRLELRAEIPETQLPLIRVGQPVTLTSDANPDLQLTGKVREIMPTINQDSRIATVKVDLPPQASLKPGMFLRSAIVTDNALSLTVPMAAVLPQPDGSGIVYIAQGDETVKRQKVEMGEIIKGGQVEIRQGLQSGDRIVLKGVAYLNDGDRISVSSEQ